ncbi:MAG TPA: M20/M25/M40 family metallo-hydrolase [Thermoanaerobaculia bacterium]|nr:M20/M25/M40 family metallo-hydrolase [Thermoanaerobaculia bacterium]
MNAPPSPADILALHRLAVSTPSVSGDEGALAEQLAGWLAAHGAWVERFGNTLLAIHEGESPDAPIILLDTHLDTVPPAPGWLRDPFVATVEEGRVYGLGSNDAKASVAAMSAAFVACLGQPLPFTLALALVEQEETKGLGTERVLAVLKERGRQLAGAIVGEPTGLDVAIAQKGLLVLELVARGDACHAAHAQALGARNAARELARDLLALEALEFPTHSTLGPVTIEPTQVRAGTARNVLPAEATALLDVRTTPEVSPEEIALRIGGAIGAEVRVLSDRLRPRATPEDSPLLTAVLSVRPVARLYGSPTLSDWALIDAPAIKCGPGRSERSHRVDEYVEEEELLDGVRFYLELIDALASTDFPGLARLQPGAFRSKEELR